MGLKFSRLVLDPFLYNGFNSAILQSLGKSPEEMEILHVFAIGFARIFAPSFKNLPQILSIPADFEMSINCKTCKTFFSIVKFRLKLFPEFCVHCIVIMNGGSGGGGGGGGLIQIKVWVGGQGVGITS